MRLDARLTTPTMRCRQGRLDIEGVSHVVTAAGSVPCARICLTSKRVRRFIHRNLKVLPRARLAGRPVYAEDRSRPSPLSIA